jgi:rSAM/selenodomain-associated transferase 1
VPPLIVVFLKFPAPGRVKTRLAESIGAERAAAIYVRLVARTLGALPADGAVIWLYGAPAECLGMIGSWVDEMLPDRGWEGELIAQPVGDLGSRLEWVFECAFARGFSKVIAVGTDCPDLRAAHFSAAWQALDRADAVFGPTVDGGYYLVGLRRPAPELFRDIPWSSYQTLTQTLGVADAMGLGVEQLEELRDIDTIDDLRALGW